MYNITIEHNDNNVVIYYKGYHRTFSLDRFKEIVSTYLTYYHEGYTDVCVELDYPLQPHLFIFETPKKLDRTPYFDKDCEKYAKFRFQLYNYILKNNLFSLTLSTPTFNETNITNITNITAQWREEIPYEDQYGAYERWVAMKTAIINTDFTDVIQRKGLINVISKGCFTNTMKYPLCNWIFAKAYRDYYIPPQIVKDGKLISNKAEQCKLCAFYTNCYGGAHQQIMQLMKYLEIGNVELLNQKRQELLDLMEETDNFAQTTIGLK
jgi:hypothetical protein